MAAVIYDRFDQLFGLVQGLHANQGVVFGPPPMGPMVVPTLGPSVANPIQVMVFLYPYALHSGTGVAQGNQVLPGGRLKSPVG
jgi:hypothetical protein